jgi:hypothetical protein
LEAFLMKNCGSFGLSRRFIIVLFGFFSGVLREFFGKSSCFQAESPKNSRRNLEAIPKNSRSHPEAIKK